MTTLIHRDPVHTFHIPVMGTAFTIDAPLKVGRFGISSVVSIGDDELDETMRLHWAPQFGLDATPIAKSEPEYRSRRITAYLNMMHDALAMQIEKLRSEPFETGTELTQYFEMLDDQSPLKLRYLDMLGCMDSQKKSQMQTELRQWVRAGAIDVNIMTKIDRTNYNAQNEPLPDEDSDALSALRGYAQSKLHSSIVFSAGFNRRLYAYISSFDDFFPDENGYIKKRVILKVSDFRSSMIQGKFLAKKGIWISEHRIESGLNCGGHAFATDGYLLGPILEEFKQNRSAMAKQFYEICNQVLIGENRPTFKHIPSVRITVQGGIGTANEDRFLRDYFEVDGTGWATPFLLVPEVTTVDDETRELLRAAGTQDLFLSEISPLGVPFNTVRNTLSERQKLERAMSGRPGSPCPKGHLVSNTEFTKKPVCTASTLYQRQKIRSLEAQGLSPEDFQAAVNAVVQKACLCEDLAAPALILNKITNKRTLSSAVCPGPNLAFFSKISTLSDMVSHIYGRLNLLNDTYRPNMFISELKMYIDYLGRELRKVAQTGRKPEYFQEFKQNLMSGIGYYKTLIPKLTLETQHYQDLMRRDLAALKLELNAIVEHHVAIFPAAANEALAAA